MDGLMVGNGIKDGHSFFDDHPFSPLAKDYMHRKAFTVEDDYRFLKYNEDEEEFEEVFEKPNNLGFWDIYSTESNFVQHIRSAGTIDIDPLFDWDILL